MKKWSMNWVGAASLAATALVGLAYGGDASGPKRYPNPPGGPIVNAAICNDGVFHKEMRCDKPTGVCVEGENDCQQFCRDRAGNPTNVPAKIREVECKSTN